MAEIKIKQDDPNSVDYENNLDGIRYKKEYEYALEDYELRFLIQSTFRRYSKYAFAMIRTDELKGSYHPIAKERKLAYNALCQVLVCTDYADQVLTFHRECEEQRRIFADAEDDPKFQSALECLRGKKRAPLIIELPTRTAFELWRRAGSWTGAMKLAGLDVMNKTQRQAAITQYILRTASPDKIPVEIRERLGPAAVQSIGDVCRRSRELGKFLTTAELPKNLKKRIRAAELTPWEVFAHMGVSLGKERKNTRYAVSKVQKFKERTAWWRNSKKTAKKIQANARRKAEQES
jgi:hypothetical protein